MQPTGFSPYQNNHKPKRRFNFRMPQLGGKFKKILLILGGILLAILLVIYLLLGELRFFANNFLRLGFLQKDYLIVLQNNFEMRPAGGFITGFGEASITMGIPTGIDFHNSYEIENEKYIEPPYPHEDMLKNEWYSGYNFRDANWEPHFPDSAETLIEFYQRAYPEKDVDGIIVMNYNVVEDLVETLGGVNVEGQEFNGQNLFKYITDTVNDVDRHNEKALIQRKDILGEMAKKLMSEAKWHPFKTKHVIVNALDKKDIFLWFESDALQRKVVKKGWGNVMRLPEDSDFIAVNIANLGSKKADRYLIKEVYHHASLTQEVPEITTEIVLRYPGYKSYYTDDYKGYMRFYIPASAEIKSEVFDANVKEVGDFKMIDTKIILPAGSKSTIKYTYTLPRTLLADDEYRLRIIKQSGDSKRYDVTVETYPDTVLMSDDFDARENRAYFEGHIDSDTDLSLRILKDVSSPYPIEQGFSDLETIHIHWNEPIEAGSGGDATNYRVIDTNHTNETVDESIEVIYAEVVNENEIKLELSGVTEQPLERYKLILNNIRDLAGNPIDPDPKEITVVQRIGNKDAEE